MAARSGGIDAGSRRVGGRLAGGAVWFGLGSGGDAPALADFLQRSKCVEGVADQLPRCQRLVVGRRPHLAGRGGCRPHEGGSHDLLADVLRRPCERRGVADPQDAFGIEGSVGQGAAALGLPQHGQLVDELAPMVERAQGPVDLLVAGISEIDGVEPAHDLVQLLRTRAEAAEEELLISQELFIHRL